MVVKLMIEQVAVEKKFNLEIEINKFINDVLRT